MRLWAWRFTVVPAKARDGTTTDESFDCDRDCRRTGGAWDDKLRAARACVLSGPRPVRHLPTARALLIDLRASPYRGRPADRGLEGSTILGRRVDWREPWEEPGEGCPGAWYRSPYVHSVYQFCRHRTSTGDRVDNPFFTRAPAQVQAAVLYFEEQDELARAYVDGVRIERLAEATTPKASTPGAVIPGRRAPPRKR